MILFSNVPSLQKAISLKRAGLSAELAGHTTDPFPAGRPTIGIGHKTGHALRFDAEPPGEISCP